ncbi:MAG: hypothetical protein ABL956_15565 [Hyphomonadaceae bacterium]
MRFRKIAASLAFVAAITPGASSQQTDAGRAAFRAIYEEMVEIDSSPTTGSCTKVVQAAEARLKAAGYTAGDVQLIVPPGKPDDGNLVATLRAPNATKKGVLLLGCELNELTRHRPLVFIDVP